MKFIRGVERLHILRHLKIIMDAGYTDFGIQSDSEKSISVSIKRKKIEFVMSKSLISSSVTISLNFLRKSFNYLIEEFAQRCSVKFRKIHKKTPVLESLFCHWRHSGVFIVDFEHISHLALLFLLLTLSR